MSHLLTLTGPLQPKTVQHNSQVLRAQPCFFLKLRTGPDKQILRELERLLAATTAERPTAASGLLVTTRQGTRSPWSSKAEDLLHRCGFVEILRIERGWCYAQPIAVAERELFDPMVEELWHEGTNLEIIAAKLFADAAPQLLASVDVLRGGVAAIKEADQRLGLALDVQEQHYLLDLFHRLSRNPTDAELMMFAQANSEHCRHKIFNAIWEVDGRAHAQSLFAAIRTTHQRHPAGTLVAYDDNGAILEGRPTRSFYPDAMGRYGEHPQLLHWAIKVETHNHPTAIAPYPGAATGVGGELRDEMACGRGGRPIAGLCGYTVSHLRFPHAALPWEDNAAQPPHVASALDIMIQAPLGAAGYANEFGRPTLCGYFRTFEMYHQGRRWGYAKPIMLAGGLAHLFPAHIHKIVFPPGTLLVQLGGPAMLIGLGGGGASSMQGGHNSAELDFASVQRDNAELQRRVLEVILAAIRLGDGNPILSIHDVGAGGLSNALPELVHTAGLGAHLNLRAIPSAEERLSPMQLWCNEAQERMVMAVSPQGLSILQELCQRELCPFAILGEATKAAQLSLTDVPNPAPVDLALDDLLGKLPRKTMIAMSAVHSQHPMPMLDFDETLRRVLQHPAVGSKEFLITIGDRTVGGLTARDQMVGPAQCPVADCAVSAMDFTGSVGQAFAIGERSPIALLDAAASARMAVGEALTNLTAAAVDPHHIKLSANWMAACGKPQDNFALWQAVAAVSGDFCDALGYAIPVGKDSLSMRVRWKDEQITSPLSLVVSAFAVCEDVRSTLTPLLDLSQETGLLLVDLGQQRTGGSILAQVQGVMGGTPPDADGALLRKFIDLIQALRSEGLLLAYHDRSDGGVLVTLCEMAFASHCGLDIFDVSNVPSQQAADLFNEELGTVLQVAMNNEKQVIARITKALGVSPRLIARPNNHGKVQLMEDGQVRWHRPLSELHQWWRHTTFNLQRLRDDPVCTEENHLSAGEPYLHSHLTFSPEPPALLRTGRAPQVAILREQGTNGQQEMARAFTLAGFVAVDVTMSDLLEGRRQLADFQVLALCGGFSYGDVLGAGRGWAESILRHPRLRDDFTTFFHRSQNMTLGVCNGCQALSHLHDLMSDKRDRMHWPRFIANRSGRYEARLVMVEVCATDSPWFAGMAGSRLPIVISHGEGRAVGGYPAAMVLRYVDGSGATATAYPANPNGSESGLAGLCCNDGRVVLMMPHPERSFLPWQLSWLPPDWHQWPEHTPWLQLFHNARRAFA